VVEANATHVRPGAGRRRPRKKNVTHRVAHQGVAS
jgi:hypothetical protein